MPTKKKYNARFPPARIKKIMQTDEDIGKVAAPVPVILSKALEIFMQSLLETASKNTQARHAKTMSTTHLKQCITSETQFDFLKELVENIPDLPVNGEDPDEDEDQPKPKRRKTPSATSTSKEKAPRKAKKKKDLNHSDSEEESISEEDEGSHSAGGFNNTVKNSHADQNLEQSRVNSKPDFPNPPPMLPSFNPTTSKQIQVSSSTSTATTSLSKSSIPSLYRPVHSEDDDYDS